MSVILPPDDLPNIAEPAARQQMIKRQRSSAKPGATALSNFGSLYPWPRARRGLAEPGKNGATI
jgi:hypothetical protein